MNGLVLCLDAGNTKSYPGSGTTWTDLTGIGNNGTLTNGPTYSSANGGAIVFDGTDDYVQTIRNDITDNSSFSLSCWFRITTLNNSFRPLIDCGNFGGGTAGYCIAINNSNRLYVAVNAGFVEISNSITTNTWYNVVATASFGTPYSLNLYLNGILGTVNTSATTNALTNNSSFVRLAQNIVGGLIRFSGNIAQASIYNRALTAAEIQQNFNALRGRYGI